MRVRIVGMVVGAILLATGLARAGYEWELDNDVTLRLGGDIRVRMTHIDRDALNPDWGFLGLPTGPALEWLRVRERVWAGLDFGEDVHLKMRLVNRWHHTSSHLRDPNNPKNDHGGPYGNTWQFPDEVIFDQLVLQLDNVMDSNWSLSLGRQDVILGNGMVLLEGSPFDQGRTIYFDGAVATYQGEQDTLKLLALWTQQKDEFALINDQNRELSYGDTTILGPYWTHRFSPAVNTDLYCLWTDVEDEIDLDDATGWIYGGRVFGAMSETVNYSLEATKLHGVGGIGDPLDLTGYMVDARLGFKLAEDTELKPRLNLEFARFSGDDAGSAGEYEGWFPVYSQYPIWREELLPIMTNAYWSNFDIYRAELALQLAENVRLSTSYARLQALEEDTAAGTTFGTGDDEHIGDLLSAFVDWQVNKSVVVKLESAFFFPGDYFADGTNSEWLRLETVFTF